MKIEYLNLVVFTATFYEYNLPVYYNSTSLSYMPGYDDALFLGEIMSGSFMSVSYARTVCENFIYLFLVFVRC